MHNFIKLEKLIKGDQVAVISPSAGLPGLFPHIFALGLKRLQEVFGLIPVEYPTTRQMGSTLEDRARDIMDAFKDKNNKAVFTSIGGDDQIKLLKFLDKQVFLDNPKPFFGYSDNTALELFLWNLGIPSYYGGAIMTQFGMNKKMHDYTIGYLQLVLFESKEVALKPSDMFNDEGLDWSNITNLDKERKMEPNEGWFWENGKSSSGILWGGCLELIDYELKVNKYLPTVEELSGTIFFSETSEEIPTDYTVKRVFTALGERGMLNNFSGFLIGRPKAWEFHHRLSPKEKVEYREAQREVTIKTIREYNKTAPIVLNMDFGHTDPQIILPVGGKITIDSVNKKIFAKY